MDNRNLLINYINSIYDLVESLQADIIKGNKISTKTVLKLSKHVAAAQRYSQVIDALEATMAEENKKLN